MGEKRRSWRIGAVQAGVLAALLMVTGCSVHVHKSGTGEDKDVQIHTPFGGLQVHKDTGGASQLGLPEYPGAALSAGTDGNDKSVDLQMGFAAWQLHVQVANYATSDPEPRVEDFYRKALGRYGAVLRCRGNEPLGEPTRTAEGLTCSDDDAARKRVHISGDSDADLELKAGSEHRQHIVAFKRGGGPGTHFALIALTLPTGTGHEGKGTEQAGNEE